MNEIHSQLYERCLHTRCESKRAWTLHVVGWSVVLALVKQLLLRFIRVVYFLRCSSTAGLFLVWIFSTLTLLRFHYGIIQLGTTILTLCDRLCTIWVILQNIWKENSWQYNKLNHLCLITILITWDAGKIMSSRIDKGCEIGFFTLYFTLLQKYNLLCIFFSSLD